MTYFKDLEPCLYFGDAVQLTAVGWLDADHPHAQGQVEIGFFRRMMELLIDPWQPGAFAGSEKCCFCQFTGGPSVVRFEQMDVTVGCNNVFIPSDSQVYVAPSLIAHYIDSHQYRPPCEFEQAVMDCPDMRSMPYLKLLRKHGVHRLR